LLPRPCFASAFMRLMFLRCFSPIVCAIHCPVPWPTGLLAKWWKVAVGITQASVLSRKYTSRMTHPRLRGMAVVILRGPGAHVKMPRVFFSHES
jgi:hypothetical protein